MEKTAADLVRFALDEAGFAEDAFNISEAAQKIGGNTNRKPVNVALSVHKTLKKTPQAAPSAGGGNMTPQDWQAHLDAKHGGKEPEPGHCKYLDAAGNPPTQGTTEKADAKTASETNVAPTAEPKEGEQQPTEQQNANEVLQKMGESTQSPGLQAAYQAAQEKLNKPTPIKVDGVEGMEGLVLYPTNTAEADFCGKMVAAAKAGAPTAKAALEMIQKKGQAGQIQGGAQQQEQQAAPQIDPHAEWEKMLPTDPKAKLAVVEQEELERVQNIRNMMAQMKAEGKDISKLEQRIEESKQKVLAARAEAEGRDLEKEAAEKAAQEAEAAKPKEMTAEEYAAEAEKYSPTTAKGMRELADKRYVDSMRMLEMQRKQAEDAGKAMKDYYERRDDIEARYKRDKENAEMVAAKESEAQREQAQENVGSSQSDVGEGQSTSPNESNNGDDLVDLDVKFALQQIEEMQWSDIPESVRKVCQEGLNGAKKRLQQIIDAPSDSSLAKYKEKAVRGLEKIKQAEAAAASKANGGESQGNAEQSPEQNGGEQEEQKTSLQPLASFFDSPIGKLQDYITQEDADMLNGIDAQYQHEPNAATRRNLIANYAACLNSIAKRARAERDMQKAQEEAKEKPAGFMAGVRNFFDRIKNSVKGNPKKNQVAGLNVAENGKMATAEQLTSIGCAVGWDRAMRGIGYVKDEAGNWVGGGPKYLCRGPRGMRYSRVGKSSVIEQSEEGGTLENTGVKRMRLENCLANFGINAKVKNVRVGSAQTTFELEAAPGTNISEVNKYKQTMMGALQSKTISVQTPIPGTNLIGVTVENQKRGIIPFSAGYNSPEWQAAIAKGGMKLPIMYGRDTNGNMVVKDITSIGHFIVGGGTNSGKSSFMKTIETGLMTALTPNQVRFVHMNPVGADVEHMKGSPYLALPNAETPQECAFASEWLFKEMENRKEVMQRDAGTADFSEYNNRVADDKKLPYIVVFADEYGNQMSWRDSSDPETRQCGLKIDKNMTQMVARARHFGIHIVVGVQRPDVKSVNGTMKMNMQGRIAFKMASGVDYGTIMDKKNLQPFEESARGTCYFRDGAGNIVSGQSVYADDDQSSKIITDYLNQAL